MSGLEAKIPCPRCGKSFSVPLGGIVPGASQPCPNCGTQIMFAGQDASKVNKVMEQLGALGPGVEVKVTVKEKRRPWWKFW
ncbi:MAG TPA: hypothetical protein DD725_06390 [Deltaproteobacteria bacterium]|nr:hypothetical protein [Deltaproteobacteria bacterium]